MVERRSTDHSESAGTASMLGFGVVVLVIGSALWSGFYGVSTVLFSPPIDLLVATVLSGIPLLAIGAFGLRAENGPTGDLAASILLVVGGMTAFLAVVGTTVLVVLAPFGLGVASTTAAWLLLGLGGTAAVATPIVIRTIGSATDRALIVRMIAVLVLLGVVSGWLLFVIWGTVFFVATAVLGPLFGFATATLGTVTVTAVVAYREYTQVATLEQRADATPTTADELPDLHATTARIAAQLDVPMPTIAISRTHAPEAMVVGFRPSSTHLVLSYLLTARESRRLRRA